MKIIFLGTRGYIDAKTKLHYRHTSTLIEYKKTKVIIDCGIDWIEKIHKIKKDAILITHAHPDHAFGLQNGIDCKVYATKESWKTLDKFNIEKKYKKIIYPRKKIKIGSLIIEAFQVIHSIRAPAIGYKITAGKVTIFYVPDLIKIKQQKAALKNVALYIGDGATINRPIIRRKNGQLFGHTTISAQVGWCKKEKVPRAIFTHCGSQIVEGDRRKIFALINAIALKHNIKTSIAHDGLELALI